MTPTFFFKYFYLNDLILYGWKLTKPANLSPISFKKTILFVFFCFLLSTKPSFNNNFNLIIDVVDDFERRFLTATSLKR